MVKHKNVHLRHTFNCELERNGTGFVLTFLTRNDKFEHTHYHFYIDNWFIGMLAKKLWQVVKWKRQELTSIQDSLTREPPEK